MRLLPALALLLLSLPGSLAAESPMGAAEFEAHTTGRTLLFTSQGRPYGAERYEAGRRVTWSFLDGECQEGEWYPQGRFICFVYEDAPEPQCWTFYAEGSGMRGLFEDRIGETELYEAGEAEEPLFCLGPKIGV